MKNLNNLPIYIYSNEFLYRAIYIVFNLLLFICVILNQFDTLIFIEIIPFIDLQQKFIVVGVTDLLELLWFLTLTLTPLFAWPLIILHLVHFFRAGWYNYQLYFIKIIFKYVFMVYSFTIIGCHWVLLPNILSLLIQWDNVFTRYKTILHINPQFNILDYVIWMVEFHYTINFWLLIFFSYVIILYLVKKLKANYKTMKYQRKIILFNLITVSFILSPPDLHLQLFTIIFFYIFIELIFFFLCFRLINTITVLKLNTINANYSTTIKKIP
uniref:TatC n=1 Tax=Pterocladia lucida TaxID=31408 RepID=A0A6M3WX97_PTELU|nr:tatC [Pterocladia lucida]